MKVFLFALLYSLNAYTAIAQTNMSSKNDITLLKGQKITIRTTSEQISLMGLGEQMKNISSVTSLLSVENVNDTTYLLSNSITKWVLSLDVMGKQTTYDSDNDSDKNSVIGKNISQQIGKPEIFLLDKFTGKLTLGNKEDKNKVADLNSLENITKGAGSNKKLIEDAFFVIPADKSKGNSWSVSDSSKDEKNVNSYTINSVGKDSARLTFTRNSISTKDIEMQGMQMNVTKNTKTTGEIVLNVKKGLVKERSTNSEIESTIDSMGHTTTINSKESNTTTYIY